MTTTAVKSVSDRESRVPKQPHARERAEEAVKSNGASSDEGVKPALRTSPQLEAYKSPIQSKLIERISRKYFGGRRNEEDRKDFVQEMQILLFRLSKKRGNSEFAENYVCKIAVNLGKKMADKARKSRQRYVTLDEQEVEDASNEFGILHENRQQLDQALGSLSERDRTTLLMQMEIDDVDECVEELRISREAWYGRLYRAMKRLRKHVNRYQGQH